MLETGLVGLAGATLLAWLGLAIDGALGKRYMVFLRRHPMPPAGAPLPSLSIVFGARDEERNVEAAVRSMLALDYPNLEIVAVDDRSADATGSILDALAAEDGRLSVLHVEELPPGWLGKNHALWLGAQQTNSELVLFTDADVKFEPTVMARSAAWMQTNGFDHLAGATDVEARGLGLQLFIATFALFFNAYFRPWRVAVPGSRAYIGFGGFNLVRREAYERAGTHAALAMDPLDDVNLGRAIKESGGRQVCAVPGSLAKVEWYPTLSAAVRGLEKNTMAGAYWSFVLLFGGIFAQMVVAVWPFLAVVLTTGWVQWLNAGAVVVLLMLHAAMLRETSLPSWLPVLLPVGVLLVAWTAARAAVLTWWRGGIEWRGTFYSLRELRERPGPDAP